jgi:hypothetical protein
MLFLHVLLFFVLGTFTLAAPIPTEQADDVSTKQADRKQADPVSMAEANPALMAQATGYWVSESVSEHCSFFRMDLIYLDRIIQRNRIAL